MVNDLRMSFWDVFQSILQAQLHLGSIWDGLGDSPLTVAVTLNVTVGECNRHVTDT